MPLRFERNVVCAFSIKEEVDKQEIPACGQLVVATWRYCVGYRDWRYFGQGMFGSIVERG
jgi:hypothetical protein